MTIHGTIDYAITTIDPHCIAKCKDCGAPIRPVNTYCMDCRDIHLPHIKKAKAQTRRLIELAKERKHARPNHT